MIKGVFDYAIINFHDCINSINTFNFDFVLTTNKFFP
jgi:hypothetical protein